MLETRSFKSYEEMKKAHQDDYNAFPLGFAFNKVQFNEMMENWGLNPETDLNKISMLPQNIGYIRKADIPAFEEMLEKHKQEKITFKEKQSNIKAMLLNEMINHEYVISGDLAEVLEAVGYTMDDYAKSPTLQKAVNEARTDYLSKY